MFGNLFALKMNILDEGGGGGAPPAPVETPPTDTYVPPEWAKGLTVEADILKAPMFSSVKDINDVVKGYYHAQKMVGADKAVIPTKSSTPEEWRAYYQKAGLPASMEEYKPELPATLENEEFKKALIAKAYDLNVRPDQLSAIVAEMEKYNDDIVKNFEASEQEEIKGTVDALKKEWGGDFQRNIIQANRVIKHFGGDELLAEIKASPLANDGKFLRLLAKVGANMTKEDSFSQDVVTRFGMGKEEAQKKINAVYGAVKTHPYFDATHAQHRDAVAEMAKLQEILSENA